jgi:D-arabinose 1-dehydrogenase-like Zn-dependent alcohol dehydrogenase
MYPCPLGYEEVGRVVEVGVDVSGVAAGDLIYCS